MYFRVALESDSTITLIRSDDDDADGGDSGDDEEVDDTSYITQLMIGRYKSLIKSPVPTSCEVSRFKSVIEMKQKKEVILIDALHKAELYSIPYTGKYFIFLMSLPHSITSKTDSYVGHTTNPIAEVYRHNNKLTIDRNTCMAAPNWKLDIVLGPFICKEAAIDCGRAWVNGTRGKESKRAKAPFLASAHNVNIYTYTKQSDRPFEELLTENCDPLFVVLLKEDEFSGEAEEEEEDCKTMSL
jgi:hypothetical protein